MNRLGYLAAMRMTWPAGWNPWLGSQTPYLGSPPACLGSSMPYPGSRRRLSGKRHLLDDLPGELAARVGALGKRCTPGEVRTVVLDLLRNRAWRIEELTTLLQLNAEYVRQTYVQPLLQTGDARMTRPEEPFPIKPDGTEGRWRWKESNATTQREEADSSEERAGLIRKML
jgi:hypothetical protein